ncbi:helix-turn-helix domain-containing protein [Streptomyces sp. TRM70350]|uniref:helix-turn-helix domain-containing protein n=1 Tax=Streptomyces sp. TRM70350 TaxID=2856165 RepID=UPI001C453037|nr:XRE family transcriptional regulator [Streptomyces sp. TRM70350]MBV7694398.1 XRE family transcriptional regulator [Streptomyces sp. TRM70350]
MRNQEVDGPHHVDAPRDVDARLGARLAQLRAERGWSLGDLAERSGVSRSTLSRAERAEISPTASMLNRLCAVFGRTMSQLLSEVEGESALLVRAADQPVWQDRACGFVRRSVSPPHAGLRGELVEGRLAVGADIAYDRPPVPGLEQHIWVLEGALAVTVQDAEHRLGAGDCLRLRVWGATRFRCAGDEDARYVLAVVLP